MVLSQRELHLHHSTKGLRCTARGSTPTHRQCLSGGNKTRVTTAVGCWEIHPRPKSFLDARWNIRVSKKSTVHGILHADMLSKDKQYIVIMDVGERKDISFDECSQSAGDLSIFTRFGASRSHVSIYIHLGTRFPHHVLFTTSHEAEGVIGRTAFRWMLGGDSGERLLSI